MIAFYQAQIGSGESSLKSDASSGCVDVLVYTLNSLQYIYLKTKMVYAENICIKLQMSKLKLWNTPVRA